MKKILKTNLSYKNIALNLFVILAVVFLTKNITGSSNKSFAQDIGIASVPNPVTNLNVTTGPFNSSSNTSSISYISWDAVPGADYYNIYLNGSLLGRNYNGNDYGDNFVRCDYNVVNPPVCDILNNLTPNTSYTITVTAANGSGESQTVSDSVTTAAGQPTYYPHVSNLQITGATEDSITISWTPALDMGGYEFYLDGNYFDSIGMADTSSYTFTGLTPGSHTLGVLITIVPGYTTDTATVEGSTQVPLSLSNPTNIVVTPSSDSAYVTWDSVLGADHYVISNGDAQYNITTSNNYVTLDNLTPATDYSYMITAYNSDETIYTSDISFNFTTLSVVPTPDPITNLTSKTRYNFLESTSSIDISWDLVSGADSYNIYLNSNLIGNTTVNYYNGSVAGDNYPNGDGLSNLQPNTPYTVGVKAVKDSVESTMVSKIVTTAGVGISGPITNLSLSTGSHFDMSYSYINISWYPILYENVHSYNIYVNSHLVDSTSSNSYVLEPLTIDTPYTIGVSAVNDYGESEIVSNNITTAGSVASSAPSPVANISLSTIYNYNDFQQTATSSIDVSWDLVNGADYYKVYLDGTLVGTTSSTTNYYNGSNAEFLFPNGVGLVNLTPGTSYTVGVSAVNNYNDGSESEITTNTIISAVPESAETISNLSLETTYNPTYSMASVDMSWSTSSKTTFYNIYLDGNYVKKTVDAKTTSEILEDLSPNTSYRVGISSVNILGESPIISDTIKTPGPEVQVTTPVVVSNGGVVLATDFYNSTSSNTESMVINNQNPSKVFNFTKYLSVNNSLNNKNEVIRWQEFLNKELKINLPITGYFGQLTLKAVKDFQTKYAEEILTPWNIKEPTGFIFKTTTALANKILTQDLKAKN